MLSTVLQNTEQLVNTVRGLAAPPPPAGQMQAQVVQTAGQLLPAVGAARSALLAVAAQSLTRINALSAEAAAGTDPGSAVQTLHLVGAAFTQAGAELTPLVGRLNVFRDSLGQDMAAMAQEQVQLNAQLAGLAAQRDHWNAELDSLKKQDTATEVLTAFFGPLAWAGSELASAIQYGKSTEAALEETNKNLADLSGQAHALEAAVNACALLSSAAGQLAAAVQNVANALNLITGDLSDDEIAASAANAVTLRLFLISLQSAMTTLQNGAA